MLNKGIYSKLVQKKNLVNSSAALSLAEFEQMAYVGLTLTAPKIPKEYRPLVESVLNMKCHTYNCKDTTSRHDKIFSKAMRSTTKRLEANVNSDIDRNLLFFLKSRN